MDNIFLPYEYYKLPSSKLWQLITNASENEGFDSEISFMSYYKGNLNLYMVLFELKRTSYYICG